MLPPMRPMAPEPAPLGGARRAARGAAPRAALWAGSGALAGLAALVGARPGSLDDAFVVLVHARHFAATGRFAPGPEGPPVDGFTSIFDVLLKALPLALGAPDALRAAGWVGIGGLVLAAAALALLARGLARPAGSSAGAPALAPWGWCAALAAATTPGLAEGTSYALETPLYALLLAASAWTVVAVRPRLALACAAVAPLVRPEGLVLGPAAWWLAARAGACSRRATLRGALLLAGVYAATSAWRWWVFGAPLPNSFYAKSSDSRWLELLDGLGYLWAAALRPDGAATVVAFAMVLGAARTHAAARDLARLAFLAAGVVAVSGGDSYTGSRLALPAGLFAWLTVAAALPVLARPGGTAGARFTLAAVGSVAGLAACSALWPALRAPHTAVRAWLSGPLGLESFADEARVVAALEQGIENARGALPGAEGPLLVAHRHAQRYAWFARELALFDLTGLTDRQIARLPAEGPVSFGRDALDAAVARRVAVIHLDHLFARPELWAGRAVAEVLTPPAAARYLGAPWPAAERVALLADAYVTASLPGLYGGYSGVNVLVRRDLAGAFAAAGFVLGD